VIYYGEHFAYCVGNRFSPQLDADLLGDLWSRGNFGNGPLASEGAMKRPDKLKPRSRHQPEYPFGRRSVIDAFFALT